MFKPAGVIAVAFFALIPAFPFLYNAVSGGGAPPPLSIEKPGECIRGEAWMRHYHMRLLFHNRDKAVREGIRGEGLVACRSCHKHKDKFCEKCHDYIGVEPECWNCHNYPA